MLGKADPPNEGRYGYFFVHRPQSAVHRLNPKKRWTAVGGRFDHFLNKKAGWA
ncbi:MAG: hypothetical protein KAW02_00775 [candidate division Zixibacteria bacterium]|nr:hypothetical protein [candidate division Zixibacteria bacterium]